MTFEDLETGLLVAMLVWTGLATAMSVMAIVIGRRQTGQAIHVVKSGARLRIMLTALIVLAAVLVVMGSGPDPRLALPTLVLGLFLTLAAPRREDSVFGTEGVRRGWHARRWEQLEGWRLSGNHLRFVVHGELVAVEVPEASVPELRTRLESAAPDGESPFKV